ncbi:MAG: hypothetical protein GY753_09765 [Gammaproteobacteria bacterium]|nr:hypothetical protein [Gammaproteobacteria bacterium]
MAFKASNYIPARAYDVVRVTAVQLKVNVESFISTMAGTDVGFEYLRGVYRTLSNADAQFTTLKATPGLADYAKDQEIDPAYDVAAEFIAMQATITAAVNWIDTHVPATANVKPPSEWGDGTVTSDVFTPAQTSGLRTRLQSVVDGIS